MRPGASTGGTSDSTDKPRVAVQTNTCRLCQEPIPARLCFCSSCLPKLTSDERLRLLVAQSAEMREQFARAVTARLRGAQAPARRESVRPPPGGAAAAFREARRLLDQILGRKT